MACSADKPNVKIDSFAFRLHYKFTAPLFMCSSLFVLIWQLINPIECVGAGVEREFVENYCWNHGTFKIKDSGTPIVINHYSWVSLTCIQGLVFLLTIFYWKSIENGRLRWLINDLWKRDVPEEEKEQQLHLVVTYFMKNRYSHSFTLLLLHFVACENFNMYNALGQFYLMGWLLGCKLFPFVMFLEPQDSMSNAFPQVTICDFNMTSFDGRILKEQTECHLNMNYLNEKIYLALWIWMGLLAMISALELIFLVWHGWFGSKFCAFMTRRLPQRSQPGSHIFKIRAFWRVRSFCDWTDIVFLNLIRQNMDPEIFKEFIEALEVKLLFPDRLENIRISINNIIANNAA